MRFRFDPMLRPIMDNPLNRMVREDRKRKKYGKATGIFSIVLGCVLLSMIVTSQNAIQGLESLSDQLITGGMFVVLALVGILCAALTGFFLLQYKYFSKVFFSLTCGLAIFFGLTLPLMEIVHSRGSLVSVVGIEGVLALLFAGVVMALSIFSA
jgi:hypothetical protein